MNTLTPAPLPSRSLPRHALSRGSGDLFTCASAMRLLLASLCLLLTSCGFFEKDNTPAPSALTVFKPEVAPRLVWGKKVGKGAGKYDYLKMSPAMSGMAIYTSSTQGFITATNKTNGITLWQSDLHADVTSGPGVGDQLVVVGCRNGDVIALSMATGGQLWKTNIHGGIIATPAVGHDKVIVKTLDGNTMGLSAHDGHKIWTYQQEEPNLILRGASAPLILENSAIVGYANGSLVRLNLNDGDLNWQQAIAVPQGGFPVQRMVDIDADPLFFNYHLYAATYQGQIASLDWVTGRTYWTREISSYTGMAADDNAVYISDTRGLIRSFQANTGELNWRQYYLQYRIISGPASMGRYVVVGDGEGYLHWLNKSNGHLAGRASLRSPIYATPLVDGNQILYVLTNSGYLAAYTIN